MVAKGSIPTIPETEDQSQEDQQEDGQDQTEQHLQKEIWKSMNSNAVVQERRKSVCVRLARIAEPDPILGSYRQIGSHGYEEFLR